MDSFYFLIVTISTVGFGDVTPTHPLTKFILILLIITGISTIAISSETIIDKIIQSRLENHYNLPEKPIDVSNHVIIVGYNHLVHNLARLLIDRFIPVIIIYDEWEKVVDARGDGFEAYTGHSESQDALEILRIETAIGIYLFHEKDNLAIQTAIFAKQINPNLRIFARTLNHLSIEYGKLVGIDRTYHRERLIASFISATSRDFRTLKLPNQNVPDAEFRLFLTYSEDEFRKQTPDTYTLGYIESNFSDLISLKNEDTKIPSDDVSVHVVAIDKDTEKSDFTNVGDPIPLRFERVVLTGYTEEIKHIAAHMAFDKSMHWFLTFHEEKYEEAIKDGANAIYCSKERLIEDLPSKLKSTDLVVVMLSEITDSLVLSAVLMKLEKRPRILQLVDQNYEVDIFKKMGIDRVISPDMLIARGMFQILLTEMNLTYSMAYRNSQMFEHKVKSNDRFHGKSVEEIAKIGYIVLLFKRNSDGIVLHNPRGVKVNESDNLMLFKEYQIYN